ncbi:L-threonylcarbamoyladenylate synthase [Bacillus massiliglaciei]|uniref:L-threonylcarbamoyladenylate synthase n=1 Tax=Bacillus massiliglaciei TaxID=1816693 RepID=UPI000AFF844B|nr:L-threonylcarbamoyladenylate synthase [Bacillus massiliglaciei]
METKFWKVDKSVDKKEGYPQIMQPADLLMNDEVVAFPTETVYGLGANAKSSTAVKKIYEAKGRPSDNPLIVHIASKQQLEEFTESIPQAAARLMAEFWPGPLTVILKEKAGVLSELVTVGLGSVGVRMPNHPVASALIQASGLPIAAPSANTSGKPSPTLAAHVKDDLDGRIAGIVDGGPTGVGVESTVVDCTGEIPVILRPGGITKEQIQEVIGKVIEDAALKNPAEAPKAPGMKYTHYAPKAPLTLVEGSQGFFQRVIDAERAEGKKVGVLAAEENKERYEADSILSPGSLADLSTVAAGLYETLRKFDQEGVNVIYSEVFPTDGIGAAIMNRLTKAAGQKIMTEKIQG